jgi:CHAT domain-containing protein/Tfp pilus assembly protein PilF
MKMWRILPLITWLAAIAPRIEAEIPLPWGRNSLQAVRNLTARQGLPAARQETERALNAARAKQDLVTQAYAHYCLGEILDRLNEETASARHMEQARELAARIPESYLLGKIHSSLSAESRDAGNSARARRHARLAADHFEAAGEHFEQSIALFRMSQFEASGERKKAILERAVAAAIKAGDPRTIGSASKALGEILLKFGDYAGSAKLLEQAVAHLRKTHMPVMYGQALMSLARVYTHHGRLEQSLETYREALGVFERAGQTAGVVGVYQEMGGSFVILGRHKEALPYFDKALEVARRERVQEIQDQRISMIAFGLSEAGEHARAAALLEETMRNAASPSGGFWVLGSVYYHMGRYEDALRMTSRAVTRTRVSGIIGQGIYAHWWRARTLDKLGRTEEAAADLLEAFRLIEKVRGNLIPDDTLKRGFGEKNVPLANDAIAILWRAGKRKEALEVAERARARAFLDLLASRDTGANAPPSALILHGDDDDEPNLPSAASSAPASAAQLGAIAARLGSAFLAYWVHPEAVYAWVVTPGGGFNAARVEIPETRLNALVERARKPSHKPDREAWRELHRILVEPLKQSLPAQGATLTILPHRALFDLPFAALCDLSGRYLIETYGLRTAPAAAILERTRQAPPASGQFLLIGDPSGLAPDDQGKPLPPLPGARSEVAKIAQQIIGAKILLTGPQAEKSRVTTSAAQSAVLHFATHAILHPSRPFDSYLALSAGSRLTAGEIYNLRLNADLVLLSACRGGSGQVSADGLLGLTRAFFYAGASSVIAPLWDIADGPTVELMEEFYRRYRQTRNKSTALRQAQLRLLSLLRAGKLTLDTPAGSVAAPEHPWLWAGFVLQGED